MRAFTFLALLVGLAGTTASASVQAPPVPVTCDSIIYPVGQVSWRPKRVVLDVVAVPPVYLSQTVPTGEKRWRYWSKSGLVVRADSPPLVVIVPRAWRTRAAITWGNSGPTSALRIETCPATGALEDWNPYSGGFLLWSRTACVPLTFVVGSRRATVRFGVGKRCG